MHALRPHKQIVRIELIVSTFSVACGFHTSKTSPLSSACLSMKPSRSIFGFLDDRNRRSECRCVFLVPEMSLNSLLSEFVSPSLPVIHRSPWPSTSDGAAYDSHYFRKALPEYSCYSRVDSTIHICVCMTGRGSESGPSLPISESSSFWINNCCTRTPHFLCCRFGSCLQVCTKHSRISSYLSLGLAFCHSHMLSRSPGCCLAVAS